MELIEHEWIENFNDYEAVLRCLNPLSAWDKNATVRAFQTFDWNHASVQDGELEFAHKNTPVVVRFDGSVIAILFGLGKLNEAVPDLFVALHGLGWRTAELYYPPESLAGLLRDFGKAIPANMDFNVIPAKSKQKISDFAEVPLMFAKNQVLNSLKNGEMNFNDIIFAEMQSMDVQDPGEPANRTSLNAMVLKDNEDELDIGNVVVSSMSQLSSNPSTAQPDRRDAVEMTNPHSVPIDLVDDQPSEFSSFGVGRSTSELDVDDAQTQADLVIENEGLRDNLSIALEKALVVDVEFLALTQAHDQVLIIAQGLSEKHDEDAAKMSEILLTNTNLQNAILSAEKNAVASSEAYSMLVQKNERLELSLDVDANFGVKVGKSVFCFDLPNSPFSVGDAAKAADFYGTDETVHLYPGAIGGPIRWDALAEIVPQYPWYTEKMVEAMGFEGSDVMPICELLLDLKQSSSSAQLRDLVNDACPEAIWHKLRPLLLCPIGQAFVDIPLELNVTNVELFTVRGTLQSSSARLIVVHIDALDGNFVAWMAELLRFVVQVHAVSKRFN